MSLKYRTFDELITSIGDNLALLKTKGHQPHILVLSDYYFDMLRYGDNFWASAIDINREKVELFGLKIFKTDREDVAEIY